MDLANIWFLHYFPIAAASFIQSSFLPPTTPSLFPSNPDYSCGAVVVKARVRKRVELGELTNSPWT